jgi:hypothetical protein
MSEENNIPLDNTTAPDPSSDVKFKAGFAVFINEDGAVFIEKDLRQFNIPVDRDATLLEIRRYTSEILMDLQAQAAAEYTSLRIAPDKAPASES